MADSYVCSGAMMKCTMGSSPAKLTVLPTRTVFLAGQPMANISDHMSMVNLGPFGVCRSMGFPATASATAAAHGVLTPMPCMHNTPAPWIGGKMDYLIKGQPALLQSCKCQCMWGGTISLINNGQVGEGAEGVNERPYEQVEIDINASSPIVAQINQEALNNYLALGKRKAIQHLIELKNINPKEALKDVPYAWRKEFNAALKSININGLDGLDSSYSDIEHAHNIYKLATSEAAKQYGIFNISHMMPHQMFDIADRIPGFLEAMPTKEFWDTFDTYVPLYTDADDGAYFSGDSIIGFVNISMSDEDNINRMTNSDWYKAGLIHHEFGHAYDKQKEWSNDPEFIALFESFQEEMGRSDITNGLITRYDEGLSVDEEEKFGSLSDCLQAATEGHDFIPPRGHENGYFNDTEKQMAEFIAHMSENYWSGNDSFESLAPDTYQNMIDLLKKRWK